MSYDLNQKPEPHIAVAPGLLDVDHTAIREADDTDADYNRRVRLLTAALAFARDQT